MSGNNEFITVSRRRRPKKSVKATQNINSFPVKIEEPEINCEEILRVVNNATNDLRNSPYRTSVFGGLNDSLCSLNIDSLCEIVCYGLGNFTQNKSSKYQLGLLLLLKAHYNCPVFLYDPLFCDKEVEVLGILGLNIIEKNEEGRRIVNDKCTLLFMPHCSKQLMNNVLYANWNENLNNCILFANSFSDLVENSITRSVEAIAGYITRILPYVNEIAIENNFEREEVFNSLAIHTFTKDNLSRVPLGFWDKREEPQYQEDIEFINAEKVPDRLRAH